MTNLVKETSIPLETMVVEYVAGRLEGTVAEGFELQMRDDPGLRELVASERLLSDDIHQINNASKSAAASNNFQELLGRLDREDRSHSDGVNSSLTLKKHTTVRLSIAASFLIAGIISVLIIGAFSDYLVEPKYQGLSSDTSTSVDLTTLITQKKIAKLVTSEPMNNQQIQKMLAAYQLQLISHVTEQNTLIVFSNKSFTQPQLEGFLSDDRLEKVSIVLSEFGG